MKKKTARGIINKKLIPVSFDIKERKKLNPPKINALFDLVVVYLKRNHIEIIAKRKQRISSRLLILLTTSV